MIPLPYQEAFVNSEAKLTVLVKQRGSGGSTAAFLASERHKSPVLSVVPQNYAQRIGRFRKLANPVQAEKLRGMHMIIIDDFSVIHFEDLGEAIKSLAVTRIKVVVDQVERGIDNSDAMKIIRSIRTEDSIIVFAATHQNTHVSSQFCEAFYGFGS